jgi:hypothetical protein
MRPRRGGVWRPEMVKHLLAAKIDKLDETKPNPGDHLGSIPRL